MSAPYQDALSSLPIFADLTDAQLQSFVAQFDTVKATEGWELFAAGSEAHHLDLLVSGRVSLYEGDDEVMRLRPPAIIGELGVLTGVRRNTTARAHDGTVLLRVEREKLMAFLEGSGELSFRFCQNLLGVLSDKINRDKRRIDEMRNRIIATQKDMKELRELVLGSHETPISKPVDDFLETNIGRNRRVNYTIVPPSTLPAAVRTKAGQTHNVWAISRTGVLLPAAAAIRGADSFQGVLVLPDTEIPIDGTPRVDGDSVHIELNLLIEEYVAHLEDYLTRAQILDVVV